MGEFQHVLQLSREFLHNVLLCAEVYQYLCASRKWLVGMYHLDVTAMFWFFGWCFAVIATHL